MLLGKNFLYGRLLHSVYMGKQLYYSYHNCIQKHKHIGDMPLLYFIEEVVPCLVRQSICCSLSESSRQH